MNYSYILLHIHFFRGHSQRLNVKLVHDPWVLPSIIFNQLSLFLSLRGSLCWPEDSMRWSSSAGRRWPCWRRATRDLRRPKSSCRGPSRSRRYSRCVCLGRGGGGRAKKDISNERARQYPHLNVLCRCWRKPKRRRARGWAARRCVNPRLITASCLMIIKVCLTWKLWRSWATRARGGWAFHAHTHTHTGF